MDIKDMLGNDLYEQVKSKLGDKEFYINDGSFIPRSRLNEVSDKLKATESKIGSYEDKLKGVEKLASENEEFKVQYTELDNKYKADIVKFNQDIENVTKKSSLKEAIVKNGGKHTDLLLGQVDLNSLTIQDDKVVGITDIITNLKTTYGDLFVETTNTSSNNDTNKQKDKQSDDNDDTDWGSIAKNFIK